MVLARSMPWLISFARANSSCKEWRPRITKWKKILTIAGLEITTPASRMLQFSLRFWSGYLDQPKKQYNDSIISNAMMAILSAFLPLALCKIQKNWCTVTVTPTIEQHGGHSRPLQKRDETRCPGGVSVSCLASRTRHECPRHNESVYMEAWHWMWTDTIYEVSQPQHTSKKGY